jgi:superfamily I DNA/RNA helicase
MELNCREANALRRLLNKAEIKPMDVAQLGLARLERAPGLGVKGLERVLIWLEQHGYELRQAAKAERSETSRQQGRVHRRLEQAQHLLEQWGWQVKRPDNDGLAGD